MGYPSLRTAVSSALLLLAANVELVAQRAAPPGVYPANGVGANPTWEQIRSTRGLAPQRLTSAAFENRDQSNGLTVGITNPPAVYAPSSANSYKPGTVIQITGTATGPGFIGYTVQWAPGVNPVSGWQTAGITLTTLGLQPVSNASLAQWDTSSITQAGYYTIQLTALTGASGNAVVAWVYLQPDLWSSNWPKWFQEGPESNSGIVPVVDSDGSIRLVMEGQGDVFDPGVLWSMTLNGTPQKTILPGAFLGRSIQPAAADVEGKGEEQILAVDRSALRVFSEDNSYISFTGGPSVLYLGATPPTAADLLGDSRLETIGFLQDLAGQAYVYPWLSDGSLAGPQFPIKVGDGWPWDAPQRVIVADIDGDGRKEFVVSEVLSSNTWTLRLFADDGSPESWKAPVLNGYPYTMVGADLDNNGLYETIVASYTANQARLDVFQPDGSERPGWPVTTPCCEWSFLAAADLNRDGRKEIVWSVGLNKLYVLTDGGAAYSPAWPVQIPAQPGLPNPQVGAVVIGDIDGDGLPEIVTIRTDYVAWPQPWGSYPTQKLVAFRLNGSVAKSWELTGSNGYDLFTLWPGWIPIIGDFNKDGMTEIGVADYLTRQTAPAQEWRGIVTMLATGAPHHAAVNDWPMIFHDPQNTSVLPSTCQYSVSGMPGSLGAGASTGSFQVTANPAACHWKAASDSTWMTVSTSYSIGATGSGTVNYSAAANTSSSARTVHITVGSQLFASTQAGVPLATLTVNVQPLDAGTAGPSGTYASGTKVCLTENPDAGWVFSNWSGATLDASNCLTLNVNTTVTAIFVSSAPQVNNRSFVSAAGNDTNNCTVSAPCRTLTRALAMTNGGGEIIVLTSGEYGQATITQPVTISAVGVDASITATSGNALTINTSGNVTIRGLTLHGPRIGNDGVMVQQVGVLRLYNVTAEGFGNGVEMAPAGDLAIYDSRFTDGWWGVWAAGGSPKVYVRTTSFDHNIFGVSGDAVVTASSAHFNTGTGFIGLNEQVVAGDRSVFNGYGIMAAQFSSCTVGLSTYSADSETVAGTSPGSTLIRGAGDALLASPIVMK